MSAQQQETADAAPVYQVRAAMIVARKANVVGNAVRGPWLYMNFYKGQFLPPDVHPDDVAHLLRTPIPGMGPDSGRPMIELAD